MDDHELERGDEISPTLRKAIKGSKISIVINSHNYASSTWCLDELLQILECKRTNLQIVMPIFYGIDPSVVRKQKGSYGVAFAAHEKGFKDRMEKVHQWRAALTEASNLCGLDSKDFSPEVKLVQKVFEDISLKLPKYQPSSEHYKDRLIGIEKKIREINSLLSIRSIDVHVIGIWGMGGIGKTTLASVLYQGLYFQFEGCSFIRDVREEHARYGPNHLRKTLLYELLNDEAILKMDSPYVASPYILEKRRCKKILMVLDDVDSSIQLEDLVEGYDQLAPGSRIIVKGLNDTESLELFHLHAFSKNSPPIDDKMLLKKVASYAGGNPLALKVLGSFLNSKSKEEWQNALNKLKKFPDEDILNVLRISYEGLDKGLQNIFLDIACLFNGSFTRDRAESLLDDGDSWVKIEISVLIEKSLIEDGKYSIGNELWMHDLLRQMGQKIICDGHAEPGHRSRLWDAKDICHVLERNTRTVAIEVISFNMSKMTRDVKACHTAFSKMCNLRILKIYCDNIGKNKFKLYLPQGLDSYLSEKLNYFQWDLFPLKSLPFNFTPENLVKLILRDSHVQKLWIHEVQSLPVLRRMDLRYSKLLTEIPHLSQLAPNLESINFEGCISLAHVIPYLENLDKLTYLNWNGCSKLGDFKEISRSTGGYPDLVKFPEISEPMEHLKCLWLNESGIEELPESIDNLISLKLFNLKSCKEIEFLPNKLCDLRKLEKLFLEGCSKLEKLPPFPPALSSLEVQYCESLKSIPDLPLFCTHLNARHCTSLKKIPELIHLRSYADFFGCQNLDQKARSTILPDHTISELLKNLGNSEVRFCYPGDDIPKWFSNQTSGTSLKITLPPFWNDDNFLGLALCLVLDLKQIKPHVVAFVKFELKIKTDNGEYPDEYCIKNLYEENEKCLDHVFMWHVPTFRETKVAL
nr:disease resistance protein RUN1-like [Ziziphus jujuba var. spinosa]